SLLSLSSLFLSFFLQSFSLSACHLSCLFLPLLFSLPILHCLLPSSPFPLVFSPSSLLSLPFGSSLVLSVLRPCIFLLCDASSSGSSLIGQAFIDRIPLSSASSIRQLPRFNLTPFEFCFPDCLVPGF
ncbi:hypothetical protein BO86DRAFT_458301, partial [Aspergillus japonicus CBS 114.51]